MDGFMYFLTIITSKPISAIAVISLCANWFFLRRIHIKSEEVGTLRATIDSKNKELEGFISKRKNAEQAQEEAVINIKNENERLSKELKHFKSPKKFTEPVVMKTDFDVFK